LIEELRHLLGRLGSGAVPGLDEALEIVRRLSREAYYTGEPLPSRATRKELDRTLAAVGSRLEPATAAGDREAAFWRQLVGSLRNHAENTWKLAAWDPGKRFAAGASHVPPEIQNHRYRQLAENLLWLHRERYPGRRMIVWSRTIQLTRDLDRLTTGEADTRERFDQLRVPGDFLFEALGRRAYLLAFTAYTGRTGRAIAGRVPSPLLVPTRGSFEDLMGRTGLAAAIVDLRGAPKGADWLRSALIARPISHKELLGIWPRHVDGLFFLHTLEPAHSLGR
jgi:erythromycin esterase-like protein